LWVLNQSDGRSTLLDIARRSGLRYPVVRRAAERLEASGLLATTAFGSPRTHDSS
jgi:aminopeptidase-like protein